MSEHRNIAVIGLDDFNLELLRHVRGAESNRFHGLIPYARIVNPEHYPIEDFLHTAHRELAEIDGGVDAIKVGWAAARNFRAAKGATAMRRSSCRAATARPGSRACRRPRTSRACRSASRMRCSAVT